MITIRRHASSLLRPAKKLSLKPKKAKSLGIALDDISSPARTRFAPSPTGFLHLGSLRTALYNYLLAKSTGGQFLLRLEDTDQKRLVQGAEDNIYESLKWCGLHWDEGPLIGGPYEPYRQSDRHEIYAQYSNTLIDSGNAYRCFCSKERLDKLRESAQRLQPPTTVSYDRNCAHISPEESAKRAESGEPYTVRFKSPNTYPAFEDLLHGKVDLQPQINKDDVRYDDQVLIKSDGLPTYHFANVIDDHHMKITHVIRGEEWLPSTPKHIAMYAAFGWTAPKFIHIPLLTSTKDKKLSKRSGDIDVMNFKKRGILPEALINFVALFGWSPRTEKKSEIHVLKELVELFNTRDLTRGNAKVDDKKLFFFNKHYLQERINRDDAEILNQGYEILKESYPDVTKEQSTRLIKFVKEHLTNIFEVKNYYYLISDPDLQNEHAQKFISSVGNNSDAKKILSTFSEVGALEDIDRTTDELVEAGVQKKVIFQTLRFALSGGIPGLKIPLLVEFIGVEEAQKRVREAMEKL
ncbi:CYFA0S09e03796g1_1 [Cyberlindnera fabianii]|uniref:Glutamate--tRNA ligase, mitochondrial n=1 Tax=Cyberlindnera fabianii TaxID=36022 RepID=A0A061AYZ9_CYBFA|nr:CYFA0S09e03796g1_1 [Cyberlindnera fabianii]